MTNTFSLSDLRMHSQMRHQRKKKRPGGKGKDGKVHTRKKNYKCEEELDQEDGRKAGNTRRKKNQG